MGRTITPKYRVEYRTNLQAIHKIAYDCHSRVDGKPVSVMAWNRRDGRASTASLEAWRRSYNQSFQKGGSNYHLSESLDAIEHIYWARIVRQSDNHVVCEANAPAFEVV